MKLKNIYPITQFQQGWSLVQVMICLILISCISVIAIPAFNHLIAKYTIRGSGFDFYHAVMFARNQAIMQGQHIILCTSQDSNQCSSNSSWQQGWMMFIDTNNNCKFDTTEKIIYAGNYLGKSLDISANQHLKSYVRFTPNGSPLTCSGAYQIGSWLFCSQGRGLRLILNEAGRLRTSNMDCQVK